MPASQRTTAKQQTGRSAGGLGISEQQACPITRQYEVCSLSGHGNHARRECAPPPCVVRIPSGTLLFRIAMRECSRWLPVAHA
jgi:hypothetical protein